MPGSGAIMPLLADNPFAVLSLISGPALLTNATGLLTLSTSNRFGLAIDRSRTLVKTLESREDTAHTALHLRQTDRVERRIMLLLNALRAFYFSIGSFAAASLVSLLGAVVSSGHSLAFPVSIGLALLTGVAGIGGLVWGCSLLVQETQLAALNVRDELALIRETYRQAAAVQEAIAPQNEP
jgi:hypothetical protein